MFVCWIGFAIFCIFCDRVELLIDFLIDSLIIKLPMESEASPECNHIKTYKHITTHTNT
jgi:hypothetical protein